MDGSQFAQSAAEAASCACVQAEKRINLALQGGGAHGAFTWGVLDRLLEDERIGFEAVSATSAGAMNAVVLAYGLTDGEIARMLQDSFQNAGDDKAARALRELQVDAQRLIEAVEAALQADGERLLDAEEREVIELQVQELRELLASNDGPAIERQSKRLSQVTDAFAARRLDSTVKAALAGRNLNEIED